MTDLSELPPVPPQDFGGDERAGLFGAGATLVVVGWGLAVLLNAILHATAPSGGLALGPWRITTVWGVYAETTALIGLMTGALGAGILWVARSVPSAPLVLPGAEL